MLYSHHYFKQIILNEINQRIVRPVRILNFNPIAEHDLMQKLQVQLPQQITIINPYNLFPESIIRKKIAELQPLFHTQPKSHIVLLYDFSQTEVGTEIISTLKTDGISVKIIASPPEIIKLARENKDCEFYVIAAGYEPLAALIAATILTAKHQQLTNIHLLAELYITSAIVPVVYHQLNDGVDGMFLPGEPAAISGFKIYEKLIRQLAVPCIIVGSEPIDILQAISMLLAQIEQNTTKLEIQYRHAIRPEGNPIACTKLESVFRVVESFWREYGTIPASQFVLKDEFAQFQG
ncbi:MAG: hypothetical protein N3A72_07015 [bacterium]|nr:hypothetical protein [bacterium]